MLGPTASRTGEKFSLQSPRRRRQPRQTRIPGQHSTGGGHPAQGRGWQQAPVAYIAQSLALARQAFREPRALEQAHLACLAQLQAQCQDLLEGPGHQGQADR